MRLSVCLTINERPVSVLDTVFASLREQTHDDMMIVLDRTPEPLAEYVVRYWQPDARTRFVRLEGDPGWRSPVTAWNAGFKALNGDALYCLSSETVQAAGNVERARAMLRQEPDTVFFGKCECSCGPQGQEVNWGGMAPGNLLCDAAHPRPLGFIWFGPLAPVKAIGGYDPRFADGLWYDDDDFYARLWATGCDFAFDDSVSGTHIHHERPVLNTAAGQDKVRRNTSIMAAKWGIQKPLNRIEYSVEARPGRTVWRHGQSG